MADRKARAASPRLLLRAVRRELGLRATTRRLETRLALAGRTSQPVIAGPWMSEVGFELLYWIPLLRRLLRRHRIAPERVTVVTRGGAGVWYGDMAAHVIDIFDLVSVERFRRFEERRQRAAGHQKQLSISPVECEILALAGLDPHRAAWAHPLLAYSRLRYVFEGRAPLVELDERCDFRRIRPAWAHPPPRLPERYIAMKAYFSECHPETASNRAFVASLISRLSAEIDVVVLDTGLTVDEHRDATGPASSRVHSLRAAMTPADNLAVQTQAIAGAAGYVATYGGMSYLGPFLGVPTSAFFSQRNFNESHLAAISRVAAGLGSARFIVRDVCAAPADEQAAAMLSTTVPR